MACNNVCVVHVDTSEECYWPKGGVHMVDIIEDTDTELVFLGAVQDVKHECWEATAEFTEAVAKEVRVSMKKVKKKAKAASDDAAVRAQAPRRSWPAPSLPIHSGGPWYSTRLDSVPRSSPRSRTGTASLARRLETATGVDVDVDALQASCGQRLPSWSRQLGVLIRGAGCSI